MNEGSCVAARSPTSNAMLDVPPLQIHTHTPGGGGPAVEPAAPNRGRAPRAAAGGRCLAHKLFPVRAEQRRPPGGDRSIANRAICILPTAAAPLRREFCTRPGLCGPSSGTTPRSNTSRRAAAVAFGAAFPQSLVLACQEGPPLLFRVLPTHSQNHSAAPCPGSQDPPDQEPYNFVWSPQYQASAGVAGCSHVWALHRGALHLGALHLGADLGPRLERTRPAEVSSLQKEQSLLRS